MRFIFWSKSINIKDRLRDQSYHNSFQSWGAGLLKNPAPLSSSSTPLPTNPGYCPLATETVIGTATLHAEPVTSPSVAVTLISPGWLSKLIKIPN